MVKEGQPPREQTTRPYLLALMQMSGGFLAVVWGELFKFDQLGRLTLMCFLVAFGLAIIGFMLLYESPGNDDKAKMGNWLLGLSMASLAFAFITELIR